MRHCDVEGGRQTVLVVTLPGVRSVGDVDLEVGGDEISVSVEDQYELLLELEHSVDPDTPSARFDKAKCQLTLTLTHARHASYGAAANAATRPCVRAMSKARFCSFLGSTQH